MSAVVRKGRVPAWLAVLGLLVSAAIALQSMGALGGWQVATVVLPYVEDGDAEEAMADEAGDGVAGPASQDLLAVHGSFDPAADVHFAFAVPVEGLPAAPAGETVSANPRGWTGEDPPRLRMGVVMIGADTRRVVVDGSVLGLGDTLGQAEIVAIDTGHMRLRWRGRMLTYDLGGEWPLEFRAEAASREPAATRTVPTGEEK